MQFNLTQKVSLFCLLVLVIVLTNCTKPPEYPIEPVIEFMGLSKTSMKQSAFPQDSLILTFSFTDGDGDLGQSPSDTSFSITMIDTRDGFVSNKFKVPVIPEQGAGNGVSGEVSILLFTTCCIFPQDSGLPPCVASTEFPTDSVSFEIHLTDRAGNQSNSIFTPPIILRCE